jgi:hypothetical protein
VSCDTAALLLASKRASAPLSQPACHSSSSKLGAFKFGRILHNAKPQPAASLAAWSWAPHSMWPRNVPAVRQCKWKKINTGGAGHARRRVGGGCRQLGGQRPFDAAGGSVSAHSRTGTRSTRNIYYATRNHATYSMQHATRDTQHAACNDSGPKAPSKLQAGR